MRLRTKFILQILITVIIVSFLILGYVNYTYVKFTTRLSYSLTELYSTEIAGSIQANLKSDMRIIENMKEFLEYNIRRNDGKLDRRLLVDLLTTVKINNPDYLATWASFELNFLDPAWRLTHGRIRYIVILDKGLSKYIIDTLDVDKENVNGAYYEMKIGKYSSLIMNPYFYTYSAEDTSSSYLETSMGLPMEYNGKFIGLIGIDVSLKKLKKLVQIVTPFKKSFAFLVANNGDIAAHPDDAFLGKRITLVYPELQKYFVLDSIKAGKKFSLNVQFGQNKEDYYFSFTPIVIADRQLPWSLVYVVPISQILSNVRSRLRLSIIPSLIAFIILFIVIWIFIVDISEKIERANETLHRLSYGHINESLKLKPHGRDELAEMYQSINKLIDNLNSTVKFALEIGRGNLEAFYELKSDDDILGKALIDMKVNLQHAKEEEEKRRKEAEKISWHQNGITEINEILRINSNDFEKLSFEVVKFLTKYLNAVQGGLYIVEQRENKKIIKLVVAYAYDRKKQIEAEFEIGEGLIGRAVMEKSIVHIKDLPQGYVFVTSGLGGETPDNLIILPLIFEEEVYGAIELLSFKPFEDYQVDFLEQAAFRIASSIYNILKNIESQRLLEQFRQQTEKMEQREKSLQEKIKELQSKEQEILMMKKRFDNLFAALDASFAHLEYDTNFVLIKVNDFFTDTFGIAKNSILGKHITEILPDARENQRWVERFIEDLSKGMVRRKQTRYSFGKKTFVFDETYIPLFDSQGKFNGVLCFGVNISKFNQQKA